MKILIQSIIEEFKKNVDVTKNWMIESAYESFLGLTFELSTNKFNGTISITDTPGNPMYVVGANFVNKQGEIETIRHTLNNEYLVHFLSSLENKEPKGERAPQDCAKPQMSEPNSQPKKFNHIF
jgi:hypothetical protein